MQRLPETQLTTIPKPFTLSVQPLSRQDVTAGSDLVLLQIYGNSQQDFLKEVGKHPALNSLQSCVDKVLGSNFGKEEGGEVVERHVQERRFKGEKVIERRNLELAQSVRGHGVQG